MVKDSAAFAAAIAAFGTATKAKLSSAAASGSPEDQSGTRKRLSPTPNELAFPMEVVHCHRHTIRSRFVGDYLCGAVHVWFPDGLVELQWSQMQAAIIAALVSLLVSATTQFWSPISQRKIERSKIELQTELESTKAGLQKELEEIKSKFTIELESARDSISAKKLAIVRLTDARNRWSESAKGAPKTLGLIYVATVGMMGREDVQEAYAWVAKHSNECLKIFDEIRPLLDVGSAHQLGMKIAEFSDADEMVMSEPYAENQGLVDLGRKAIAAKYGFTVMLGTCISITLERLTRSRFSIQSLFADI